MSQRVLFWSQPVFSMACFPDFTW